MPADIISDDNVAVSRVPMVAFHRGAKQKPGQSRRIAECNNRIDQTDPAGPAGRGPDAI